MSNEEILAQMSHVNYACLYVEDRCEHVKFGPGRQAWKHILLESTPDVSKKLVIRIEKVQHLLTKAKCAKG